MIEGISHITFIVRDLDRTTRFLKDVFEAEPVYDSGEKTHSLTPERFFRIGGIWIAIMEGDALIEKTYNHVAFRISEEDLPAYEQRVHNAGVTVRTNRPRVPGEGHSIYFHDFDNHLFELHTGTLEERLETYAALDDSDR